MSIIEKQTIAYLRYVHGSYNTIVILLFIFQGWLGLRIKKQRKAGDQSLKAIKIHRKTGQIFALMGVTGFLAGVTLIYIDYGHLLKYPFHFIAGLAIALLIITTFFISKKIKGTEPHWRNLHLKLGIFIISLYLIQAFLGMGILF